MATPVEVAHSIFDAMGKRDLEAVMALVADDCVDDYVAIAEFRGKASVRQFFEELLGAFPDFEIVVDRVTGDDEVAVVQWQASGTFTGGPFQGIDPTGRRVAIRGVDVMVVTDGLVRQDTIYHDGASFARQIGMLPRMGTGTDRTVLAAFNMATRLRQRFNG